MVKLIDLDEIKKIRCGDTTCSGRMQTKEIMVICEYCGRVCGLKLNEITSGELEHGKKTV